MKKTIAFTLLILLLGAACQSEKMATFSGEVNGLVVSFSYPESWTAVTETGGMVVVSDQAVMDNEATLEDNTRIQITTLPTSALATDSLTALLENEVRALQQIEGATVVEPVTEVTINDRDATTAVLLSQNGRNTLQIVLLGTDSNLALIFAETEPDEADTLLPAVESLIQSITLTELLQ